MSEKTYIVTSYLQVQPYLESGYARSERSAKEQLGAHWDLLPASEQVTLVVVEIDTEKHRLLNDTHLKKYRMYFGETVTCFASCCVASVRVLEEGADEGALIAREDRDSPPEHCGEHALFDTPGECIDDKRQFILDMIVHMRRSADALETFLKHTKAL
mgnify:CR=1 FL=1